MDQERHPHGVGRGLASAGPTADEVQVERHAAVQDRRSLRNAERPRGRRPHGAWLKGSRVQPIGSGPVHKKTG